MVDELVFATLLFKLSLPSLHSTNNNNYYYFYWHNISSSETHKWSLDAVTGTVQNRV